MLHLHKKQQQNISGLTGLESDNKIPADVDFLMSPYVMPKKSSLDNNPYEDGFPLESGFSQRSFLVSFMDVFSYYCHLWLTH